MKAYNAWLNTEQAGRRDAGTPGAAPLTGCHDDETGEAPLSIPVFDTEWIRSIVDQCWEADAACFVKQLGRHWARTHGARSRTGADPTEWPEGLRVRAFPVS